MCILFVGFGTQPRIRAATGNTYYVAITGDDNNPGTYSQPWRTPEHAFNIAVAGDTVNFMAGDYYTNNLTITNSGSAESGYITFQNYQSDTVNIHLYETNWNGLHCEQSYIRIIGLRFDGKNPSHLVYGNATDGYYSCRYGLYFINCDHIFVQNCRVSYTFWCGLYCNTCHDITYDSVELDHVRQVTFWGEECMSICGTYNFEVKNCRVHNGGDPALGIDIKEGSHDGSVHDCHVYNLPGLWNAGIYIDARGDCYNIDIYNNLIHDIHGIGGCGISIGDESDAYDIYDIKIYNNVIYNCQQTGVLLYARTNDTYTDIYIVNNTVYNCGTALYRACYDIRVLPAHASNIVVRNNTGYALVANMYTIYDAGSLYATGKLLVDHNLWYNSGGKWNAGSVKGTDYIESEPRHVNITNDLNILAGSPAIDAGSATDAPSNDYLGVSRPQGSGVDIGAYEYNIISQ